MSKYIVTAFENKSNRPGEERQVAIDLKQITDMNPMIGACEREGVDGVVILVSGKKDTKYAYFVILDTFVEFIAWDMGLDFD